MSNVLEIQPGANSPDVILKRITHDFADNIENVFVFFKTKDGDVRTFLFDPGDVAFMCVAAVEAQCAAHDILNRKLIP